jgi:hypothetical protein
MSGYLRKNAVLIIIVGFSLVLGSVYAAEAASKQIPLSGTSWSVSGKSSLSYSFTYKKKHYAKTVVKNESGTMTFAPGGVFSGDVFTGKWTQKGNNYTLSETPSALITFIENLLSAKGVIGTPTIKTITVGGTVSSTKTSEKITLTAHVTGTIAVTTPALVTASFSESLIMSGAPATTTEPSPAIAGEEDSPEGQSELFGEMLDDIVEAINGDQ